MIKGLVMSIKIVLILPVLELLMFILFGDILGFFPVLFLIILSALVGFYFLRSGMNPKNIAANPKEWIFTKFAGVLLIIPGFITDLGGIFLLIRSLRYLIWNFVPDKTKNYFYDDERKSKDEEIIEVDYKDLDDK
tara:strand:+ start:226 stop:630 length:405 start_codon:yes stop_codon:yes gene_type:complete